MKNSEIKNYDLKKFIRTLDDDYLTSISNRGILKRSYKDLEKEPVRMEPPEQVIAVAKGADVLIGRVGDAVVTLKLPLEESVCSCPAYGVCKHMVMTILAVKRQLGAEDAEDAEAGREAGGRGNEKTGRENKGRSREAAVGEPGGRKREAAVGEPENRRNGAVSGESEGRGREAIAGEPEGRRQEVSVGEGEGRGREAVSGESKGRIRGKASGTVKGRRQEAAAGEPQVDNVGRISEEWDFGQVQAALASVRTLLTDMLMAGGARLAAETVNTLERQAIQCHNAGLASMENRLRVLSDMVSGYQGRRASVTAAHILQCMTEIHSLATRMEHMLQSGGDIAPLAGEFRSQYREIPNLYLAGMGRRHFVSSAGYEGETVYFLEENTSEWYTYTVVRPTFYDGRRKANFGHEAPWNLPCTLYQLAESRIHLCGGKANAEHRLSSTSQAEAELLGKSILWGSGLSKNIYSDFAMLWEEYRRRIDRHAMQEAYSGQGVDTDPYAAKGGLCETEKLFLVQPRRILDMRYEEACQRLVFFLEDGTGRRLRSQLTYSKQEAEAIEGLEKMQRELAGNPGSTPVFLGILYVEDGECTMYPIEMIKR